MYPLIVKNIMGNKEIELNNTFSLVLKRAPTLIVASIIVSLIVFAGIFLLIIPGVIFGIWYFYTFPFIMFENRGVLDGMRASKAFASDKKLKTFYFISVPFMMLFLGGLITNPLFIAIPEVRMIINIILDSVIITWFSVIPAYVYLKYHKHHQEPDQIAKKSPMSLANILILVIMLGALIAGFMIFTSGSNESRPSPANNYVPEKSIPYPFPGTNTNQKNYTNSIGMDFVLIPAGEFDMGSPSDEWDRYGREGPVHKVNISYGFYLGKYEVTQKQWHEVMVDKPSFFKDDDRPVESVSWNQVKEFINRLNAKEGTDKYRLPSEAEWEYAARAGTTTPHSFGEWKLTVEVQGVVLLCISCSPQSFNESSLIAEEGEFFDVETIFKKIRKANELMLDGYAWNKGNSNGETHPVGQKKPNPWGLYDMHGNVWEWVQDSYRSDYKITPTDGSTWEGGDGWVWDIFGSKRVVRGGSWYGSNCCRSAHRNYRTPDERSHALGFRLLRAQ